MDNKLLTVTFDPTEFMTIKIEDFIEINKKSQAFDELTDLLKDFITRKENKNE